MRPLLPINTALATAEMREFLLRNGALTAPLFTEAFSALIRSEVTCWQKVARETAIQTD